MNLIIFILIASWVFSGWPQILQNPAFPPEIKSTEAADWLVGWGFRNKITISNTNVNSDLTEFPLLVTIAETGGGSSNIGYNVSDTTNGYDIRFTDSSGTTLLAYERETFSVNSGNLSANFWVKVPTITSATSTEIYIYYTNSGQTGSDWTNATSDLSNCTSITNSQCVWKEGASQDYKGVWHLKEGDIDGGAGDIKDSTSNANNGTTSGMNESDQVVGKINGSFDFDGTNDHVNMGDLSALDNASTLTLSLWGRRNAANNYLTVGKRTSSSLSTAIGGWNDGRIYYNVSNGVNSWFSIASNDNNWHHLVLVFNGGLSGTARLVGYFDGSAPSGTYTGTPPATTANLGNFNIGLLETFYTNGLIDEVRISSNPRSANWIKFEYYNQSSVTNELTFGSQDIYSTDRYWIDGAGNWSDTSHWSNSSGGSGGASLPDGTMSVFFDSNSGTGTVTIDSASVSVTDFTNSSANINISPGSNTLNVSGDFTNLGTFVSNTGTVVFNGIGAQSISGANLFYGLVITGGDRTVSFQSGVAQTIASGGSLTLTGTLDHILTLAPITSESAWKLNISTTGVTQSISHVSVSYSDATGITDFNSTVDGTGEQVTNGGNNSNWNFFNLSTAIEIRAKNYTTSVGSITFPEGAPESTVSNPYNDVDSSGSPQAFGGTGVAEPVVTLYNDNASALKIWYHITSFTNGIVSDEYYLINNKGAACSNPNCITEASVFDTDTDTGIVISAGSGNEKDLYLKAVLSAVAGKSGSSTLTILGEAI